MHLITVVVMVTLIVIDCRYVLRNRPEVWTDELRARTRDGGAVFVNLLSSMEVSI